MINPWENNWTISCDWACHIARGSSGGTDYAMPVGTPITAAYDGTLINRPPVQYPDSGNVAILTRTDGLAFYHLHLSQFVTPGVVREGDIIGYSGGAVGAPGSGASTGPHLHVNAYVGFVIRDIHDFYTAPADVNNTPIIPQPKVDEMITLVKATDGPANWGVIVGNTKTVFPGNSVGAAAVRGWTKIAALQQGVDITAVKTVSLSGEEFTAVFG